LPVELALKEGCLQFQLAAVRPRGGKVAPFVGTQWEGYAVVLIIGFFAVGLILSLLGTIELLK